jgi:hypothetical protein
LNEGDRVVVQNIQDSLVVMQKLRSKDESKAPMLIYENNQWHLKCNEGFTLKVGKATLDIQPNGQVVIEGQDILTDATGVNRLLGSRIELN